MLRRQEDDLLKLIGVVGCGSLLGIPIGDRAEVFPWRIKDV